MYVCAYIIYMMEHYSAIKKNEILVFITIWVNLEYIKLNEISQKTINIMISLKCAI